MLYYTSLLFITNIIHSSLVCCYVGEYMTILLTCSSILHHSKYYDNYIGKKIVYCTDVTLVCTVYTYTLYQIYILDAMYLTRATLSIATILGILTVFFERYLNNWRLYHGFFHLFGSITGHLVLLEYPNKCSCIC